MKIYRFLRLIRGFWGFSIEFGIEIFIQLIQLSSTNYICIHMKILYTKNCGFYLTFTSKNAVIGIIIIKSFDKIHLFLLKLYIF